MLNAERAARRVGDGARRPARQGARLWGSEIAVDRVLVIGNGPRAEWPRFGQSAEIVAEFAELLSSLRRRPCTVRLLCTRSMFIGWMQAAVAPLLNTHYDGILIDLGTDDALAHTPVDEWSASLAALLRMLTIAVPGAEIVVMGVHRDVHARSLTEPPVHLHSQRLNAASRAVCASFLNVSYSDPDAERASEKVDVLA